ncbi:MAG: hypothetical protein KJ000_24075 [Pirellulaceae bacterium]|nr:hypothetical protein [Pirellulaceae bacterium]
MNGESAERTETDSSAANAAGGRVPEPAASPKPTVEPVSQPAEPPKLVEPADARQLVDLLDLQKLSAPEGSTVAGMSATKLQVTAPVSVATAVDFYRSTLEQLGWKRTGPETAESVTDSFAQVSFGKVGYLLMLTVLSSNPKESNVTIEHLGNFDARTLPRLDGAEDRYSTQTSSLYFARGKVDEATAALRQMMKSGGWQEYDRGGSPAADLSEASDLLFRQKACSVRVFISKPPGEPDKVAVQCSVAMLERDLPAPEDAQNVQIQDSRWMLTCEVPRDIAGTAQYYRQAMPDIGFPSPPHESSADRSLSLSFEAEGHDLVIVSLKASGDQVTQVKFEGYSAAFREKMKEAAATAQAKQETEAKAAAQAGAERAKESEEASKRQDEMINRAIGDVLKEATKPSGQTDSTNEIQAEINKQLENALKGAGPRGKDAPAN